MNSSRILIVFVCFCVMHLSNLSFAQTGSTSKKDAFRYYMNRAENYKNANLSGESLESVNKAIHVARSRVNKMEALLFKGELMRSTGNHPKALDALWQMKALEFSKNERIWEIRLLGRLAAVHQELGLYPIEKIEDSVRHYLGLALKLTEENPDKYKFEIALLRNELGMFVYRKGFTKEAREHYRVSCEIFERLGEDRYLVTPLSNLLELESCALNKKASDSLEIKLNKLIQGKTWFEQTIGAYRALHIAANVWGDTIKELNYLNGYLNANLDYTKKVNSDKMLALSEIYERDKLKREVTNEKLKGKRKALQLAEAKENRNRLILYLIIALGVAVVIVLLLFRERGIKREINTMNEKLNQANERYHLLVVESNHRIKNNLQMITAMLEYTGKGVDPSNNKLLNSISGKINAISALHKHLYVDIHNEFIPVATYFNELIKLYDGISTDRFSVSMDVGDIQIKSERIVYFGLIFNEMLSNTLEHSPDTIDQIQICIEESANEYHFIYCDNSSRSSESRDGTGSELIRNLVIRVGGRNFTLDPKTGTYQFYFKNDGSNSNAL